MGITLPSEFSARMKSQLGQSFPDFITALEKQVPVSIRFNKRKKQSLDFTSANTVPWEPEAVYLPERPAFTFDPLFHAGVYYVQEASSMIIGEIIRRLPDINDARLAIDLCAAPGGKSTHLLDSLPNTIVLSNEVVQKRVAALKHNLIRWGNPNSLVCNYPIENLSRSGLKADLVLVDAPCSGEGLFRKDSDSIAHWNSHNLSLCTHRQSEILSQAVQMVRTGGYLIYSTCTYNPEENINQTTRLADLGFEAIKFDFPKEWGIEIINEQRAIGYQFYPHRLSGEGFFVSVWRKTSSETNSNVPILKPDKEYNKISTSNKILIENVFQIKNAEIVEFQNKICLLPLSSESVSSKIRIKPLFDLGTFIRGAFIPAHPLALVTTSALSIPSLALDHDQAIQYLNRHPSFNPNSKVRGILTMSYRACTLGFVKIMDHRVNNYYPQEWRILKDIPV